MTEYDLMDAIRGVVGRWTRGKTTHESAMERIAELIRNYDRKHNAVQRP